MKRWAVWVVALYFLILVVLTSPLILICFRSSKVLEVIFAPLTEWQYWVVVGLFVAAQGLMLLVPVRLSMGRPQAQRPVISTILASGLMMGVLGAGAAASIIEFIRKEHADATSPALPFGILLGIWAIWTVVFYRTTRTVATMDVVTQQCRYLLRGSILELLIAVPTHIVARTRDYCCAGFYTFLGIAFGISVMLFSFGPGVFFLFVARWKRLHPQAQRAAG